METKPIATSLAVLAAAAMGISTGWSDLTASARKLESQYEKQLKSLKEDLEDALSAPDKLRKSDYLEAREAETDAHARLEEARKRHAKYGRAKALVAHAKGKWIGGAEKGIAEAKEQLKNADGAAARKAAKEALAKWEKNKEEGLVALEERQAVLDAAERDKTEAEKALEEAKDDLAEAKARTMESIEELGLRDLLSSDAFDTRLAKYVVKLENGRNELRFKRYSDGHAKGITIKDFKLVPWERRLTASAENEPAAEEHAMSPSYRRLLGTSLLRDLARLSAEGNLQPLPMDLSITGSKVRLLEAKGNGILAFQALDGGKIVPVALDDLALEDHALLARLVARLRPGDPTANARAGVYMESLGDASLAAAYQRKAGPEAVERFVAMHGGAVE